MEGKLPQSAITVTKYSELDRWFTAFARGLLNLLILVGAPGLQKSWGLRQKIGSHGCWIAGHATPLAMFIQLYRHLDELIVIDDVDDLYRNPEAVRLLKSVCQTDPRKRVSWLSGSLILKQEGIPQQFVTSSRLAIISNSWTTLNRNVAAIEDRGHVIVFAPDPLEVHRRVATWFRDPMIFDYIGDHLHLIAQPSMRLYQLAAAEKDAGLDWKESFLQRIGLTGVRLLVARYLADHSYKTAAERVAAFVNATGMCAATFYNHARSLNPHRNTPKVTLTLDNALPQPQDVIDALRRRYGNLGRG